MRTPPPVAFLIGLGLAATAELAVAILGPGTVVAVGTAVAAGVVQEQALRVCGVRRGARLLVHAAAPLSAALLLGGLLVVPLDVVFIATISASAAAAWAVASGHRRTAAAMATALVALAAGGTVAGAGAWSVDEPAATTPAMVAGNGVVVSVDTHAFLLQQAVTILRNDAVTAVADFLASQDPTAPLARRPDGKPTRAHATYLWRLQLGARDADRVLKKPEMPDHFFNWWTHSGKGLIAGTSAATWAEQQFTLAAKLWGTGDRAGAMYRLGAAAHLVGDACAPPHASPFVPNHRAYEEWVVANQDKYAVTSGGIYRQDFRVTTGHGGDEWSSSHPRGWVDECAHRSAELLIDTAQPPPDDPAEATPYVNTMDNFKDAQRLTAGYLAFFFDTVGTP